MVFEVIGDNFSKDIVVKTVWNSAIRLLGDSGFSKTGLWLVEWNEDRQKGILRASHKTVAHVRAALALIREIDSAPVIFHVLGVSGTIKKARQKWLSELADD